MVLRGSTPRSLGGGSLAALVLLGLVLLPLAPGLTKPPPTPEPARAVDRVAPPAAGAIDDPNVTPPLPGPKATPAPAPAPKPAPALSHEALQKAEDEVELLEAQHRVKEAQLVASKVALDHGTVRLQRIEKLSATGAVGEREVLSAQQEVDGLKGQVMVREAELRESAVRLSQARRNLKRLSDVPEPGKKPDDTTRLKELEDKLDRLLKEVDSLRRQLKEKPGGKLDPGAADVPILPTRGARIPFQILEGAKDRIARVQLLSSTDGGKTWQHAARANPDEKSFDFRAPAPGLYSLGVRLEYKDGRHEPADESQVMPGLRVLVVDKPE